MGLVKTVATVSHSLTGKPLWIITVDQIFLVWGAVFSILCDQGMSVHFKLYKNTGSRFLYLKKNE